MTCLEGDGVVCPQKVSVTQQDLISPRRTAPAATSRIQGNQPFPALYLPRHTTTQSTAADALDPSEQKSHPRSNENAYLSTSQFLTPQFLNDEFRQPVLKQPISGHQ
jgi:hypothetical protein